MQKKENNTIGETIIVALIAGALVFLFLEGIVPKPQGYIPLAIASAICGWWAARVMVRMED